MRWVIGALLALGLAAPARAATLAIHTYDLEVLDDQYLNCPPKTPDSDGGCDRCLPLSYWPSLSFLRIFCAPDLSACTGYNYCVACNGSCGRRALERVRLRSVFSIQGEVTNDVITGCNQWRYQQYCDAPVISGAYVKDIEVNFSFRIPSRTRSFENLHIEPDYRLLVEQVTGGSAGDPFEAWTRRVVLFGLLADLAPHDRDHWLRAAALSLWWLIRTEATSDSDTLLDIAELPSDLDGEEWSDLDDIHRASCHEWIFRDCATAIEQTSWGRIKARMREGRGPR